MNPSERIPLTGEILDKLEQTARDFPGWNTLDTLTILRLIHEVRQGRRCLDRHEFAEAGAQITTWG